MPRVHWTLAGCLALSCLTLADSPAVAQNTATKKVSSAPLRFASFHSQAGWQITHLREWEPYLVQTMDDVPDGLVYFQKQDNDVERVAVAALPAAELTAARLMEQVRADAPRRYKQLKLTAVTGTTFLGGPACKMTFQGVPHTHPKVLTESIVVTFVRGEYAYVLSARTSVAQFKTRKSVLEKMIHSFGFRSSHPDQIVAR
jgi:hypothetical protein